MEFVQKKRGHKHSFTFHDNHFNFAYEDKAGSGDTDIRYADFPLKHSIKIQQNEWLRNVGYLWIIVGVLQISYAVYADLALSGKGFWLTIGIACLIWERFSRIKFSVYQTEQANVFIIQDKQHELITQEIMSRRKSQLLEWYGEINFENPLDNEIHKFKWLQEQAVISQEECDKKIAQLELEKNKLLEVTPTLLN